MTLVIDIETVPLDAAMMEPYPAADRQPPSNYKLPEAVAQWRVKDVLAWDNARAKECSLTPRLGRVLCIGIRGAAESSQFERNWRSRCVRYQRRIACLKRRDGLIARASACC